MCVQLKLAPYTSFVPLAFFAQFKTFAFEKKSNCDFDLVIEIVLILTHHTFNGLASNVEPFTSNPSLC